MQFKKIIIKVAYLVFFCCNENKENILFLILVGTSGKGSERKSD